jgi:hypothetical protein
MNKRLQFSLILIFALSILVSACTGAATQVDLPPTATSTSVVEPVPTQEIAVDAATDAPALEPTEEEVVVPTEEPIKPELKTALVATDPGSVNLASGTPTLVEFFAFW